eukprot:971916-Amphidinium_carterae.1
MHGDPPERDHTQHFDPMQIERRQARQCDIMSNSAEAFTATISQPFASGLLELRSTTKTNLSVF